MSNQSKPFTFMNIAKAVAKPFVMPYGYLATVGIIYIVFWMSLGALPHSLVTKATLVLDLVTLLILLKPIFPTIAAMLGFIFSVVTFSDPRKGVPEAVWQYVKIVSWFVVANGFVGILFSFDTGLETKETARQVFENGVWQLVLIAVTALFASIAFDMKMGNARDTITKWFLYLTATAALVFMFNLDDKAATMWKAAKPSTAHAASIVPKAKATTLVAAGATCTDEAAKEAVVATDGLAIPFRLGKGSCRIIATTEKVFFGVAYDPEDVAGFVSNNPKSYYERDTTLNSKKGFRIKAKASGFQERDEVILFVVLKSDVVEMQKTMTDEQIAARLSQEAWEAMSKS